MIELRVLLPMPTPPVLVVRVGVCEQPHRAVVDLVGRDRGRLRLQGGVDRLRRGHVGRNLTELARRPRPFTPAQIRTRYRRRRA